MNFATFGGNLKVFESTGKNVEEKAVFKARYSVCNVSKSRRVSWAGDGKWLTGPPDESGYLSVLKYEHGSKLTRMRQIPDVSTAVFLNYTNRHLVIGSTSGAVRLWDIKTKSVFKTLCDSGPEPIKFVSVSFDDTYVAACGQYSENPTIKLFGITTNRLMHTLPLDEPGEFSDLKFSSVKKSILCCSTSEGRIIVWDLFKLPAPIMDIHTGSSCTGIALSPVNYTVIASISLGGLVILHDIKKKIIVHEISTGLRLTCVDLVNNEILLGTADGRVLVYDLLTNAKTRDLACHEHPVESIQVFHDRHAKSKPLEELGLNTPDEPIVEKPVLEMSVADIYTPPSTASIAPRSIPGRLLGSGFDGISPVPLGTSCRSSFAAAHSTPNGLFDSPPLNNDSFLRLVASPVGPSPIPSPLARPPTSLPLTSSLRPLDGIKEEVETSHEKTKSVNGIQSNPDETKDLLKSILSAMTEIRKEIKETREEVRTVRTEISKLRADMENSKKDMRDEVERGVGRCRDWIIFLYNFQEQIVRDFDWDRFPIYDYNPDFLRNS